MANQIADAEGGLNINASNPNLDTGLNRNSNNDEEQKAPLVGGNERELSFAQLAGTIESSEKQRMKKLLFRATKGTALTFFSDYDKPQKDVNGNMVLKSVYVIVF